MGVITHILSGCIDFVGNTGRQLADGFHLLGLQQLVLKNLALGDIAGDTPESNPVAIRIFH